MKKLLLPISMLALVWSVHAKESKNAANQEREESLGRVQYALILPDEKTPELVKAEENSPFQPSSSGTKKAEENTEENQVREILLQLPAVGGASGSSGMRVMLGGMRLVEGGMVPPVLPDQQVGLRVKSITSSAVELIWIEKKPTGLPPKVLTIPLDGAPKVRYRLPTNGSASGGARAPVSAMGSLRRNGVAVLLSPAESGNEVQPPLEPAASMPMATPQIAVVEEIRAAEIPTPSPQVAAAEEIEISETTAPSPASTPLPPPSDVPEASVLRMLFGKHAPAGK